MYCRHDALNNVIASLTDKTIVVSNCGDCGLETINGIDYICEKIHVVREMLLSNPYLVALYATNMSLDFKDRPYKVVALPYGINIYQEEAILNSRKNQARDILCYANFRTYSNTDRYTVKKYFESKSWAVTQVDTFLATAESLTAYANYLQRSKFVACPEGAGLDSYRVWEVIYSGAIPIVQNSYMNQRYAQLLPMLLVNNFGEVTQELLSDKYNTYQNHDRYAAYTEYYKERLASFV